MKIAWLPLILLAPGCAAQRPLSLSDAKEPEIAQLARLLHDSSVDVRASLRMLAEVNNAATQPALSAKQKRAAIIAATQTPRGMERTLTLSWVGPVEQALETIAHETGYHLEIVGEPPVPALPVVRIDGTMPAINAVRDLGFQLQDRARVSVYEQGSTVVLEYWR